MPPTSTPTPVVRQKPPRSSVCLITCSLDFRPVTVPFGPADARNIRASDLRTSRRKARIQSHMLDACCQGSVSLAADLVQRLGAGEPTLTLAYPFVQQHCP